MVIKMMEKITTLLKQKNCLIPSILFRNYRKLNITERQLIILIYLLNEDANSFNPKEIGEILGISLSEVITEISTMASEGILKLEMRKNGSKRDEVICLDQLYEKLGFMIMNQEEIKPENETNLYAIFEEEFGRTISPMEYEIINAWVDDYTEELILLALKEATYNGVSNLRYIDKILHEWKKKGIRRKEDVEKDKQKFQRGKVENKELFDYDWLNDNE